MFALPDGGFLSSYLFGGAGIWPGAHGLGLVRYRPVPVLHSARLASGTFAAVIGGDKGWTYRVETATDLRTWAPIRELPSTGPLTEFEDLAARDFNRRFYRAVRVER